MAPAVTREELEAWGQQYVGRFISAKPTARAGKQEFERVVGGKLRGRCVRVEAGKRGHGVWCYLENGLRIYKEHSSRKAGTRGRGLKQSTLFTPEEQ